MFIDLVLRFFGDLNLEGILVEVIMIIWLGFFNLFGIVFKIIDVERDNCFGVFILLWVVLLLVGEVIIILKFLEVMWDFGDED